MSFHAALDSIQLTFADGLEAPFSTDGFGETGRIWSTSGELLATRQLRAHRGAIALNIYASLIAKECVDALLHPAKIEKTRWCQWCSNER